MLKTIEKDEELVSLTSLYIHLLDQLEWELLTEKVVKEHCYEIKKMIIKKLELSLEKVEKIDNLIENYEDIFIKYMIEKNESNI